MSTKRLNEKEVKSILPSIMNLDVYNVWHNHEDEAVGNLDLSGTKINVRKNVSNMILSLVRAGEMLGIDVTPKESMTVQEYFDKTKNLLRASVTN